MEPRTNGPTTHKSTGAGDVRGVEARGVLDFFIQVTKEDLKIWSEWEMKHKAKETRPDFFACRNATDGEAVEVGVEDGCTMAAKPACLEMKFDDTEENDGAILTIDSCNDDDSTDEELVAITLITEV